MALRLGVTWAVAARATRSHRAAVYLLLLVYHLFLLLFHGSSSLIHLLASRPATRSEGVSRSVSSPPVALRLAARCMPLPVLPFRESSQRQKREKEQPSHRGYVAVVFALNCSPSLLRGGSGASW